MRDDEWMDAVKESESSSPKVPKGPKGRMDPWQNPDMAAQRAKLRELRVTSEFDRSYAALPKKKRADVGKKVENLLQANGVFGIQKALQQQTSWPLLPFKPDPNSDATKLLSFVAWDAIKGKELEYKPGDVIVAASRDDSDEAIEFLKER